MFKNKISDVEETEDAIYQRSQLRRVRVLLLEAEAPQDLIEAVEIAIEDIERFIDPVIETAMAECSQQRS